MIGPLIHMKRSIRIYGDPVLREKAEEVTAIDEQVRALARDMIETMHAQSGIGLAAQQVGETVSICVVDLPAEMDQDEDGAPMNPGVRMPMILLNPVILESDRKATSREEGCLSFPEIMGKIERPWTVTVRHKDLDGTSHERTYHGMLARVLQHEIDHLNGVLFIDRMSHVKRLALKGKLKRMRRETEEALAE